MLTKMVLKMTKFLMVDGMKYSVVVINVPVTDLVWY
jgi:hypothetical protein